MFAYLFLHIPIAFNTTSAPTSAAISTRSAVGWERGGSKKKLERKERCSYCSMFNVFVLRDKCMPSEQSSCILIETKTAMTLGEMCTPCNPYSV